MQPCHIRHEPGDEQNGGWTREQLLESAVRCSDGASVRARIGEPSKRSRSGQTCGKHWPALDDTTDAGNSGRTVALERERARVCHPLGNRNAVVVQSASSHGGKPPDGPVMMPLRVGRLQPW